MLDINRLNEVLEKAGFYAAAKIFLHAKAADGDAAERMTGDQLSHEIKAAAIRQADVADDNIELLNAGGFQSGRN